MAFDATRVTSVDLRELCCALFKKPRLTSCSPRLAGRLERFGLRLQRVFAKGRQPWATLRSAHGYDGFGPLARQRAVRAEPTKPPVKIPAAWKVFVQKTVWRCYSLGPKGRRGSRRPWAVGRALQPTSLPHPRGSCLLQAGNNLLTECATNRPFDAWFGNGPFPNRGRWRQKVTKSRSGGQWLVTACRPLEAVQRLSGGCLPILNQCVTDVGSSK